MAPGNIFQRHSWSGGNDAFPKHRKKRDFICPVVYAERRYIYTSVHNTAALYGNGYYGDRDCSADILFGRGFDFIAVYADIFQKTSA